MANNRQMWTISPIVAMLIVVVVGLQVVIPACSLYTLTLHREFRFQQIESAYLDGTATVEIVTNEREIQWTFEERECTWQGHTFDIIHVSRSNGTIRIIAFPDEKEDETKQSINTALSREQQSERTINKVLAAFLLCPVHTDNSNVDTVIHTSELKAPLGAMVDGMVEGWQGDVPAPPPWTWFRI